LTAAVAFHTLGSALMQPNGVVCPFVHVITGVLRLNTW
jgi:hypothetical protein